MSIISLIIWFLGIISILFGSAAFCQAKTEESSLEFLLNKNYSLTVGLFAGSINGDTSYRINFSAGVSQLEFPLNNSLVGLEVTVSYKIPEIHQNKLGQLTLRWLTNTRKTAGKMKDSDWFENDGNPGVDIYSESDADLTASLIDFNYTYNFLSNKWISLGTTLGYLFQKFSYDIYDVNQVGYGPYKDLFTISVPGKVLDYEVKYHLPYLGIINTELVGNRFRLNFRVSYGFVIAKDRDDHILRYKLSTSLCKGNAFFSNFNLEWAIFNHWSFYISGNYLNIDTKGKQNQVFYDGPYKGISFQDIPNKIISNSQIFYLGVNYKF